MLLQTGVIRLAFLASPDGSKVKTLYLPPPARDGLALEWAKKATTRELVNGGERSRTKGYLPVLTCKWGLYDDHSAGVYTLGVADGQRPPLEDLLVLLSQPTGMLKVSPGLTAAGFTVDSATVKPVGKKAGFYTGLEVTFRGRDPLPQMTLGVF